MNNNGSIQNAMVWWEILGPVDYVDATWHAPPNKVPSLMAVGSGKAGSLV